MRAGGRDAVVEQAWKNAAGYSNLSELQLSLGRIALAVADAERSVDYADRSGDAFGAWPSRTTLADARHQQSEWEAARRGFAEAEAMQAEAPTRVPAALLAAGFRYGELLLAEAERAAWGGPVAAEGSEAYAQVAQRAAQTLHGPKSAKPSLEIPRPRPLTLARCALYADLLHGRPPGEDAQQQHRSRRRRPAPGGPARRTPRGLLTRAWLPPPERPPRRSSRPAEAQRIAERGGMKLHLADIALTRARLFEDKAELARPVR